MVGIAWLFFHFIFFFTVTSVGPDFSRRWEISSLIRLQILFVGALFLHLAAAEHGSMRLAVIHVEEDLIGYYLSTYALLGVAGLE